VWDLIPLPRRQAVAPPDHLADAEELAHWLGVEPATRRYLLYFVLPAWIGAGLLDWQRHRQTKIEETGGTHESLIHALTMAELGLPIRSNSHSRMCRGSSCWPGRPCGW
jgi:hypothetical protein